MSQANTPEIGLKAGSSLKRAVAKWPYGVLSILAAIAAFGAYTSMYAFRKAFAAGSYSGLSFWHVDYKAWLVIAQVLGYTLSKFYGIKFIAEIKALSRGRSILLLVAVAWLALLGFALVPAPYNIVFLFINGFPLGMIWGLVFGYLEGRRATEFMAAVLSTSLIFASGFVKTVGRTLITEFNVKEYHMPFLTGAIFAIPLILFVLILELMPPPNQQDKQLRTERVAMSSQERRAFLARFLPGIILTVIVYVLLTVMRDVRDNFEVEIWAGLGINSNSIYANIDSIISLAVLAGISLLILVKNNLKAFGIIHVFIICGCLLAGISTLLFEAKSISAVTWMTLAGLGLYAAYVPYNAIFFERMIASFNYKSNVGFIMYIADAIGYLGSISVLLVKELGNSDVSWDVFFKNGLLVMSVVGAIAGSLSLIYFLHGARKEQAQKKALNLSVI
jgi:MFS family permease